MLMTHEDEKPIVVGYDGSPGAVAAVRWAAQEAAFRHAPLRIVQSWTSGQFGTDAEKEQYTERSVAEACRNLITDSSVEWEARAVCGKPADVLASEGGAGQMLVVGSRQYGLISELAHGSVGLRVATRESAPVVVVVRD
jgi:nucleotide-binding universal stress UspA family protein